MIYDDDDAPEFTEEVKARARPAAEVLPPEVLAQFGRGRGRPKSENPKVQMNLRIDQDVVDAFKADGPGWQTRMNDALRSAVASVAPTVTAADAIRAAGQRRDGATGRFGGAQKAKSPGQKARA